MIDLEQVAAKTSSSSKPQKEKSKPQQKSKPPPTAAAGSSASASSDVSRKRKAGEPAKKDDAPPGKKIKRKPGRQNLDEIDRSVHHFQCHYCTDVFASISNRTSHIEGQHTHRFKCEFCKRKYMRKKGRNEKHVSECPANPRSKFYSKDAVIYEDEATSSDSHTEYESDAAVISSDD